MTGRLHTDQCSCIGCWKSQRTQNSRVKNSNRLRRYIYEYMVRKNLPISAQIFQEEAQLLIEPGDIDDSSSSFLPDWWSIFSDAFFASRSDGGSQSTPNEALFFMSSHQPCARVLEPVSSIKEGHLETQNLQPRITLPGVVNLGGDSLRDELPITHSQPIKPEYQSRYVGLDENWIKHSNFFNDMKKNVQSNSFIPTAHLQDGHVQHVTIRSSSQTNFGNARLTGPHPVDSKGKAPISGLPDTDERVAEMGEHYLRRGHTGLLENNFLFLVLCRLSSHNSSKISFSKVFMDTSQWDHEMMLRRYIHDYMVRKNLHISAKIFQEEAKVPVEPPAINDSSWGFLLEWWSIFSDVFFSRQSNNGSQSTPYKTPFFVPNWQPCATVLEPGSSIKDGRLKTHSIQPSMILPREINHGGNPLHRDFPIRPIQPVKQEYQSRYVGLDENWIKQSDFLKDMTKDVQSTSIKGKSTSILTADLQDHVQHVATQSPQKMNFGSHILLGSRSVNLYDTAKGKLPLSGSPDAGVELVVEQNKKSRGSSFTGTSQTSTLMEHEGLGQLFMQHKQLQHLQPLTSNFHVKDSSVFDLLDEALNKIDSKNGDADHSEQIGSLTENYEGSVTRPAEDKNKRKTKEPFHFESEDCTGNKDIAGPSKISSPSSHASPFQQASLPRTLTESYGEAAMDEISKPLVNVNDNTQEDSAVSLPSSSDAHGESIGQKLVSIGEKNSLDENRDDTEGTQLKSDQNKLSGQLTGTRKRKQPSDSGSEVNAEVRDVIDLPKISSPCSSAPSEEASTFRTSMRNYEGAAITEITKPMDNLDVADEEDCPEESTKYHPVTEHACDENNRDKPSSMVQQGPMNENKDDVKG